MYVEFNILSAHKVYEANRTIWLVSVEDNTNLALVKVENNEMEEVQKFKKNNPVSKLQTGIAKQ